MSEEVAPIPVEGVSMATESDHEAWHWLVVAENSLQVKAQQIATVQSLITNIERMLGSLYEAQGLDRPTNISNVGGGTG